MMITALRSGTSLSRRLVFVASSTRGSVGALCSNGPAENIRSFSSGRRSAPPPSFRPSRRPSPNYRPIKAKTKQRKSRFPVVEMGKVENAKDELEAQFGPLAAAAIREAEREKLRPRSAEEMYEEYLRMTDYMTAESGSNEELVLERRALAHHMEDPKEREEFLEYVDDLMRKGRIESLNLENDTKYKTDGRLEVSPDSFIGKDDDVEDPEERDPDVTLDPNQLAHGEWSEWLITVDRNTKLWRGGRLESYRALVIGGNLNGCGGFGVGKASDPILAVDIAGRRCKRNIFFVDRYQGNGLTRDLVGKQNSCKVTLRATDTGLRGNELATEILKRFGITNCVAKAYGNRNVYNVVRATFKALLTHESLEEIALKRGKRLVSVDRAMRLKI